MVLKDTYEFLLKSLQTGIRKDILDFLFMASLDTFDISYLNPKSKKADKFETQMMNLNYAKFFKCLYFFLRQIPSPFCVLLNLNCFAPD